MKKDLLIIGAGPAGLNAGLYAARYKIDHLLIGEMVGGQASMAVEICNFLTEISIKGVDIIRKMENTARHYGVCIRYGKVELIKKIEDRFLAKTKEGDEIEAKAVILATGTERRKIGLDKEAEFTGRGVHYCATCDGPLYRGKIVGVIGGGNAALTAAIFLADVASQVYLICREKSPEEFRAETAWIENVLRNKKIEILWDTNVKAFLGDKFLEEVLLDKEHKGSKKIKIDGIFIEIGAIPTIPKTEGFNLKTAPNGAIEIDRAQATNVFGLFAAGDVTTGSNGFKQIVTALSEGAIAADSAFKYLKNKYGKH